MIIRLKRWLIDFEYHAVLKLDGNRLWVPFDIIYQDDTRYCEVRWPQEARISDYVIDFLLDNVEATCEEKRLYTH